MKIIRTVCCMLISTSCSLLLSSCADTISLNNYDYDNADLSEVYQEEISGPVSNIILDWNTGPVYFLESDTNSIVVIQYGESDFESHNTVEAREENGTLTLTDKRPNSQGIKEKWPSVLKVYLPQEDFISLNIDSGSANIFCDGVSFGKLTVDAISGILEYTGVINEIDIKSTTGIFEISSTAMPQSVKVDINSGNLTLRLPENSGFTVDYNKSTANFDCEFPTQNTSGDTYVYGDGSISITVDIMNGNFEIVKA